MDYKSVANELKERLVKDLKDEIEAIILYGSVARKEATADSDIDIFVIVKNKSKVYDKISRIRTEIDIKNSTLTSLFILTENEFRKYLSWRSPFLNEVKKGVVLYDSGKFRKICESVSTKELKRL